MSTPPPFNPDDPFRTPPGSAPPPDATVRLGGPVPGLPPAVPTRIPGLDFSETAPDLYVPDEPTMRLGASAAPPPAAPPDEGRTVAYYAAPSVGGEPVVGWLVCVDGAARGRDYRLHVGRNFVGRSPQMHVALAGDEAVSRDKHCIVVYDPRANAFRVAPGESAALTYLNGASVDVPTPLAAYDRIEVGKTTLLFLPLCSDRFSWDTSGE